jgi:hypothetical protein
MGQLPVLLVDHPPKFSERGGHFYVDVGVENVPVLAFSPHDLLEGIRAAASVFADWDAKKGDVVRPLDAMCVETEDS